ncbi:MAG: hypothetical protein WCT52_04720 [Candidatus Micrarchaeia archaeon]
MGDAFTIIATEFAKNPLSFISAVIVVLTALFYYFGQAKYIARGIDKKNEVATREILLSGATNFIKFVVLPAMLVVVSASMITTINTFNFELLWLIVPVALLVFGGSCVMENLFGKEDPRVFVPDTLHKPFAIVLMFSTVAFILAFLVLRVDDYSPFSIFMKTLTIISIIWFPRSLIIWAYAKKEPKRK